MLPLPALAAAALLSAPLASDLPAGFSEAVVLDDIASPASFDFAPDGRIFFTERIAGRLRVATESPPGSGSWTVDPEPYATFDVPTSGGVPTAHRSSGVRGFAFDPAFTTNGFVYVFYMKDNPRQNRVVRVRQDPSDPSRALPGEMLLLDLPFNSAGASGSHNGGALRFGADGMLYVTTGDGWSGGDGVQSLSTFTGKVLRIAPDGTIPTDNAFYGQANGAYRAIHALGLRNPYTMSFDPQTGWLLIGEANGGSKARVLRVEPGANYGHEGYGGIGMPRSPWADASSAGGELITGGAWYPQSGPYPPEYHGSYFVALWGSNGSNGGPPGQISRVRSALDPTVESFATDVGEFDGGGTRLKPVHLRVGPDGCVYYLLTSYTTGAGRIVRIDHGDGSSVATPTIAPDGGTFPGPIVVDLASATPGAEIRWTADGSLPTPMSRPYVQPIPVRFDATIRARAFLGAEESAVASADFVIGGAPNVPPVARAGPDQIAELDTTVVLNGAASDDPDGSNLLLSEQWVQVTGPPVALGNDDEAVAFFRPNEAGRYGFRLDVTDGFDADSDVTVVSVVQCVNDVRRGLVARWGFEEGEGPLALESASGLWNGALEGPAWSDLGVTEGGGTLDFDGTSDVVQVGGLDVAGEAMTLTAWIRPDDFEVADARVVSKSTGVAEKQHHWMLSTIGVGQEHRLRFRLRTNGSTESLVASGGALTAGEWAFVAAVYDGTRMRLFLDADPVGETPASGPIDTSPATPVALGNQPGGGRPFDGRLDDVRIYDRALSAQELAILAGRARRFECYNGGATRR
ncbi:MAG: PQQ-dependent sugar dehydrogenase [Planctomycetota bacterium]